VGAAGEYMVHTETGGTSLGKNGKGASFDTRGCSSLDDVGTWLRWGRLMIVMQNSAESRLMCQGQ
jgi:hypothetical protein